MGDVGDDRAERIDVGVGGAASIVPAPLEGMARGAVMDLARCWLRSECFSKLLVLRLMLLRLPGRPPRCRSWIDDGARVAVSE